MARTYSVTRVGDLPDSSAKSDFHNLVDNATVAGSGTLTDADVAALASGTEGDILYRGASAFTKLNIGTAGQHYRVNSGATAPECSSSILLPETTAPTTAASQGVVYTKDTGGQPELFYREESDGDEVQITSAGAVNISGVTLSAIEDYGTSASASTSKDQSALKICYGTISITSSGSQAITNLPFTSSSTYTITMSVDKATDPTAKTMLAARNSGAQFTIYNFMSTTENFQWMAIGT